MKTKEEEKENESWALKIYQLCLEKRIHIQFTE